MALEHVDDEALAGGLGGNYAAHIAAVPLFLVVLEIMGATATPGWRRSRASAAVSMSRLSSPALFGTTSYSGSTMFIWSMCRRKVLSDCASQFTWKPARMGRPQRDVGACPFGRRHLTYWAKTLLRGSR